MPIHVVGQSFGSVSGAVLAHVVGDVVIDDNETAQTVNTTGENITYTIYSTSATNYINEEFEIDLFAGLHRDTSAHEYSNRYLPAEIHFKFKECPFGFFITRKNSRYACRCPTLKYINDTKCFIQNQTIIKQIDSWLGEVTLHDIQSFPGPSSILVGRNHRVPQSCCTDTAHLDQDHYGCDLISWKVGSQ